MKEQEIAEQIQELISTNLPAIQARSMREYIDNAEIIKSEFEVLKNRQQDILNKLSDLEEENKALQGRIRELVPFKTKSEEVLELERDLRVKIAEIRFEALEKENKTIKSLVETVFKKPSRYVTESHAGPVVVPGPKDCYSTVETHNSTKIISESEE